MEAKKCHQLKMDEYEDQYQLKKMLKIRTFDELQNDLSERISDSQRNFSLNNQIIIDHGSSKIQNQGSCMREPINLNRDINKALNPFYCPNKSSQFLTTERKLVMDVLQMMAQPSLESQTFVRDKRQLKVLFKLRNDSFGFNSCTALSHLSQGTVRNVLKNFLSMSNDLQKTLFFFRGIQQNSEKLSTVLQSLVFFFNNVLQQFNTEINDLLSISLLQAGQISKSQISFGPIQDSKVLFIYPQYENQPLTLMKLQTLLQQKGLFSKITTLKDIMEKGILDYVASNYANNQNDDQEYIENQQLDNFLKMADIQNKNSMNQERNEKLNNSDSDGNNQEEFNQEANFLNYQSFINNVENPRNYPSARLKFEFIKAADRTTYLLNYLYMQIQTDQLLIDNLQEIGNERLNTYKECFLICLKPYMRILNDWVCKGDDDLSSHDLKNEFFIKANHRLLYGNQGLINKEQQIQNQNSRKQWQESYVFRTINISQLLGQAMGEVDFGQMLDINDELQADDSDINNRKSFLAKNNSDQNINYEQKKHTKDQIEISCPIFLRPIMEQILSVGKSIKIIRFLENNQMHQSKIKKFCTNKNPNLIEKFHDIRFQEAVPARQSLDHTGIDYENLSLKNCIKIQIPFETLVQRNYQNSKENRNRHIPLVNQNQNKDGPSFEIETIAKNFIDRLQQPEQNNQDSKNQYNYNHKIAQIQNIIQEQLIMAPFQLTNQNYNNNNCIEFGQNNNKMDEQMEDELQIDQQHIKQNFLGLFNLPQVIRSSEANKNNYDYLHEQQINTQQEKNSINFQKQIYQKLHLQQDSQYSTDSNSPKQLEMETDEVDRKKKLFGNKRLASNLIIGDGCRKIDLLFNQNYLNLAQQELSVYKQSMLRYQSNEAFDYYLSNTLNKSELQITNHNKLQFKALTVESYVFDTILLPVQNIFHKTSHQFLQHYFMSENSMYCQFQDQVKMLHQVYFLQGVPMNQFLVQLFEMLDSEVGQRKIENILYQINTNFQESLGEHLDQSLKNLNRIQICQNMWISFDETLMPNKKQLEKSNVSECLKSLKLNYLCEWPVEIVIDRITIERKYNKIFKQLVQIKYAKYLMEKREIFIKEPNLLRKTSSYSYAQIYKSEINEMGAIQTIYYQNQVHLGQLMHKLQIFQSQLLNFMTTMEDYFMNRATFLECHQFLQKLNKTKIFDHHQQEQNSKTNQNYPVQDLDDIIELHDNHLMRILQLCLLDSKSQELLRYIMEVVDICLHLRKLITSYLLFEDDKSSEKDDLSNYLNEDENEHDFNQKRQTRSKKIQDKFEGLGVFKFHSSEFSSNMRNCQQQLNELMEVFRNHMHVLTINLNKLTTQQSGKIVRSYLLEILQRLNFNNYYLTRENEGLPPDGFY